MIWSVFCKDVFRWPSSLTCLFYSKEKYFIKHYSEVPPSMIELKYGQNRLLVKFLRKKICVKFCLSGWAQLATRQLSLETWPNKTAAAYKIFVDKISLPTKKTLKLFFQEKLILTRMKIGSRVPGLIGLVSLKQKISGGEKTPDTAVVHQEPRLSKRLEPWPLPYRKHVTVCTLYIIFS